MGHLHLAGDSVLPCGLAQGQHHQITLTSGPSLCNNIQFSVPYIEYPPGGSSKKGSHVYFLLIVVMVLLL